MLVNVAEGVLVFRARLGAGGSGNANRQRALVIAPYLLLQRRPTPPWSYFCTRGSTVVCAASVRCLAGVGWLSGQRLPLQSKPGHHPFAMDSRESGV